MSFLKQKGLTLKIALLGGALGGIVGVASEKVVAYGAVGAILGVAVALFIGGLTGSGSDGGGDDSGGDGGD